MGLGWGVGGGCSSARSTETETVPPRVVAPPPSCSSRPGRARKGRQGQLARPPAQKSCSEPFRARDSFSHSCPNQDQLSRDWALHWSLSDSFLGSDSLGVCSYLASLLPSLCHLLTGPVHGPLPSQDLRLLPGTEPLTPESPLAQASGK